MLFPASSPQDNDIKQLALVMALHCVRNTIIETYHSDGKLSDAEMKAFNIEVVNKLYSMLQLTLNYEYREVFEVVLKNPTFYYPPTEWNEPEFDQGIRRAIERLIEQQ